MGLLDVQIIMLYIVGLLQNGNCIHDALNLPSRWNVDLPIVGGAYGVVSMYGVSLLADVLKVLIAYHAVCSCTISCKNNYIYVRATVKT